MGHLCGLQFQIRRCVQHVLQSRDLTPQPEPTAWQLEGETAVEYALDLYHGLAARFGQGKLQTQHCPVKKTQGPRENDATPEAAQ